MAYNLYFVYSGPTELLFVLLCIFLGFYLSCILSVQELLVLTRLERIADFSFGATT